MKSKVEVLEKVTLTIRLMLFLLSVNAFESIAKDTEDIVDIFGTKNDRMISIATGLSQPITKAPGVASVIDAEEIERIGAITLGEVLETIAGIHVTPVRGFVPSFVIRGIFNSANNNVLIMVDGTPMNDAGSNSLLLTH